MKSAAQSCGLSFLLLIQAWTMSAQDIESHKKPCSAADTRSATRALEDARKALSRAIDTFKSPSAADVQRQSKWFGALASDSADKVRKTYEDALTAATFSQFYCPVVNNFAFKWDDGDLAAVHKSAPGAIFLTPDLFKTNATGVDSMMGTLVHELTHLVGIGRKPEVYGSSSAKALAVKDPSGARKNSDNDQYYVEDLTFGLP